MTGEGRPVATAAMCAHAFEALLASFSGAKLGAPGYPDHDCPLFVSWETEHRGGGASLRGCIGTLDPRRLHRGLPEYALTSALRDRRFSPVEPREVPTLRCSVSLLTAFERARDHMDWEVGVHGLVISFVDGRTRQQRSATYLPEIPEREGWTKEETIQSLVRKSGYQGEVGVTLLSSLTVTRYQSTHASLSYAEFTRQFAPQRQEAPVVLR